jgi:anti-sigma factor RsiW
MNTTEQILDLQAYVDGELPPERRAQVEAALSADADARELVAGLRNLSGLIRANEPELKVPASREFYWSQIQRQIDAAEKQSREEAVPAASALGWLRWLVPALGVATVAVVVSLRPGKTPDTNVTLAAANVDSFQADSSSVMFRSESDGVTVHWIQ